MATEVNRNVAGTHTNPDPISKTPGSHPGATAAGSASGAAVGAVIGAVAGAAVGGGVGHEAGEVHDPSVGNPSKVDAAVRDKVAEAKSTARTA